MIQKEKHNEKKILALILSLACVTGLLAGCGRHRTPVKEKLTEAPWKSKHPTPGMKLIRKQAF